MYSPHTPNQDWHQGLAQSVKSSQQLWDENRDLQGRFVNYISELQRFQAAIQQFEAEQQQDRLQQAKKTMQEMQQQAAKVGEMLMEKRAELITVLRDGVQIVAELQKDLINNRLFAWKNQQRLHQIGFPFENREQALDDLQKEFGWLAEQNWQLRTFATYLIDLVRRGPQNNDQNAQICVHNLSAIIEQLNKLLSLLISQSFLVTVQPDLVLKTGSKFVTETRLLIGDSLGIRQHLVNTNVTVKIIAEEDARQLANGQIGDKNVKVIGEITNSFEKITMNDKGHICAKFNNSKLTKVAPRGKQQTRSSSSSTDHKNSASATATTDQKYSLYFQISAFQLENIGKVEPYCLSLPLMVTVNISQDCNVRGPILWRIAFGNTNWNQERNDSQPITWEELCPVLRYQFAQFTTAHRLLSDFDLNYLYEKIFGSPMVDYGATITFVKFARSELRAGVEFSFWDWFYAIMVLIKQKLLKYWEEGWCIGFIGRQTANDALLSHEPSFLLRFSDSQLGAVSFVFSTEGGPNHLAPFSIRELELLSLSQRIDSCPQLQRIGYILGKEGPVPKDSILEYFKKEEQAAMQTCKSTGYVSSQIIMVINSPTSGGDCSSINSTTTTPSPFSYEQSYSPYDPRSPGEIRPNDLGDLPQYDMMMDYGDVNTLLGEFVGAWQNPPIAQQLNTPTIERLINMPTGFNLNPIQGDPNQQQQPYSNNQFPF